MRQKDGEKGERVQFRKDLQTKMQAEATAEDSEGRAACSVAVMSYQRGQCSADGDWQAGTRQEKSVLQCLGYRFTGCQ